MAFARNGALPRGAGRRKISQAGGCVKGLWINVAHPAFRQAAPTPDHFIPLLNLDGLAAAGSCACRVLIDGYAYGSFSMTCFGLDAECPQARDAGPAGRLPDPSAIPPEDTNA